MLLPCFVTKFVLLFVLIVFTSAFAVVSCLGLGSPATERRRRAATMVNERTPLTGGDDFKMRSLQVEECPATITTLATE